MYLAEVACLSVAFSETTFRKFVVSKFDGIVSRLKPLRDGLVGHELYGELHDLPDIRIFMQHHVFAVWDFMSLLKALQRKMTCTQTPWLPVSNAAACRLINEIALCEESDVDRQGGYASHFELYRRAMNACGASTARVDLFLKFVSGGDSVDQAMRRLDIPDTVRAFVLGTLHTVRSSQLCELVASFTFGREDLLPDLFVEIVEDINQQDSGPLDDFKYYLDRHIEMDGDHHGPMARSLLEAVCGDDQGKWQLAERAAISSLEARKLLWDGIVSDIRRQNRQGPLVASRYKAQQNGCNLLNATVQMAWLDGLSVDEIRRQSHLSLDAIRKILSSEVQDRSRAFGDQLLTQR